MILFHENNGVDALQVLLLNQPLKYLYMEHINNRPFPLQEPGAPQNLIFYELARLSFQVVSTVFLCHILLY